MKLQDLLLKMAAKKRQVTTFRRQPQKEERKYTKALASNGT